MVNLADLRSPWGVLGALGVVLGRPWEVQSRLWEGLGGSRGKGHRTWRLQGGVWEPTSATPGRVHIHKTHIFVRYFDYLENRRFSQSEFRGRWGLSFGGVGSAPCGPFGPPGECANFFLSSRGPLWSGQSLHHDGFCFKSCTEIEGFVFELFRFWERPGRLQNWWAAANEVQGTPPEKLISDFGAKMGCGCGQNGPIRRNAHGRWGGGTPPSRRGACKSLFQISLEDS